MTRKTKPKQSSNSPKGDAVSLHGVSLKEALKGLLKVPTQPEARSVKGVKKPKKKMSRRK